MRILMVVSHLRKGGPVDVIYNICKYLCGVLHLHVDIVTLRPESDNSKLQDFLDLGVQVMQLGYSYPMCELFPHKLRREIERVARKCNSDIIHCHGYHSVIACANIRQYKRIVTLHNRANEDFINSFGPILGTYMLRRYLKALRRFDTNVSVSYSAECLYKEMNLPNVRCVNNGITPTNYPIEPSADKREKMRYALNLPQKGIIIASSGRIEKEKRYPELIKWFNHISHNSNMHLLILGDGSLLEGCKEIAANNPQIIFKGRVSNVSEYLQCSDFYISNSMSEGMSMAVCEAISCGLFPILSNIPSHRDVAVNINGYLFDDLGDIDMNHIISRTVDPNALHQYIRDNFSIETMGNGYFELYKELTK